MIARFFQSQLDYVLFVNGLAFIILALLCHMIHKQGRPFLPWRTMILFGLIRGCAEWLDMLNLSINLGPIILALRIILMGISFFLLLEFARRGWAPRGRRPGFWIPLCLVVAGFTGGLSGLAGLDASFRYSLALTGSVGAALVLWRAGSAEADPRIRRGLMQAGVALSVYSILAGLVVPRAGFPPATFMNQEYFFDTFGIPVQLARAALIILLAFSFHTIAVRKIADRLPAAGFQGLTFLQRHSIVVFAVILALGWVFTEAMGRYEEGLQKKSLLARARTVAAAINEDRILHLKGVRSDVDHPDYVRLKELLTRVRQANPDSRFLYLMIMKQEQVVFLVDSEPADSADYSPPGQVYTEASPSILECFKTGDTIIEGPIEDRWGIWVSAFVPITDKSGRLITLLGMDIGADLWLSNLDKARLIPILVILLVTVLLLMSFVIRSKTREATLRILESETLYRTLVEGSPNVICMLDRKGHFVSINKSGEAALHKTIQELQGKSYKSLWPSEEQPKVEAAVEQVLTGRAASFEGRYILPGGETTFWHVILNPVREIEGPLRCIVGIQNDITAYREARDALHRKSGVS